VKPKKKWKWLHTLRNCVNEVACQHILWCCRYQNNILSFLFFWMGLVVL